jgi:serine/threonine protein kinase
MRRQSFDEALGDELARLTEDVTAERLGAHLLWYRLLRDRLAGRDSARIAADLRDPARRGQLKEQLKAAAGDTLRALIGHMLQIRPHTDSVALVDPAALGVDPNQFSVTYYYDTESSRFASLDDPGKVIIRVYYSLDHTLDAGAEAALHFALMGAARKVTDDESAPPRERYAPLRDASGSLIVSPRIMVAKKPHAVTDRDAPISAERHALGCINLRDLTLPRFYTPESKKTLPGLWSLPRFADFGEDRRLYYEYIEGVPMQSMIDSPRFDLLARLIAVKHMAQTLHYIHSRGYVHNDIKPANVLLTRRGAAVIIDFGLADKYIAAHRMLHSERYRKAAGTPLYMSPEQLTGRSRGALAIGAIRYAAPIVSPDERAELHRRSPEKLVRIDGIEFREADAGWHGEKAPFFHDSYLHANVFSTERGAVVPITGKSDIFSLGVNLLHICTGRYHVPNPRDAGAIIATLSDNRLSLTDVGRDLPEPLNIAERGDAERYRELLEKLILDMLEHNPHRRPPAHEVAARLRDIIRLYFGGDRAFFSTFDDECVYVRNRLFRAASPGDARNAITDLSAPAPS